MTTLNEMIAGRRLAELGTDLLAHRDTLVTMIETGREAVSGMPLTNITPEGPLGLQLTVIDTLLALLEISPASVSPERAAGQ